MKCRKVSHLAHYLNFPISHASFGNLPNGLIESPPLPPTQHPVEPKRTPLLFFKCIFITGNVKQQQWTHQGVDGTGRVERGWGLWQNDNGGNRCSKWCIMRLADARWRWRWHCHWQFFEQEIILIDFVWHLLLQRKWDFARADTIVWTQLCPGITWLKMPLVKINPCRKIPFHIITEKERSEKVNFCWILSGRKSCSRSQNLCSTTKTNRTKFCLIKYTVQQSLGNKYWDKY